MRALQLMQQALPQVKKDDDHGAASQFYLSLGNMLLSNRGYNEAWRLQYLTDIGVLRTTTKAGTSAITPAAHRYTPTARRSITPSPRVGKKPPRTASAGGGAWSRQWK